MSPLNKKLRDCWIFAIGTGGSVGLALTGAICLVRDIDTVSSNVVSIVFGLAMGAVNAYAWRESEAERRALAAEQEGRS